MQYKVIFYYGHKPLNLEGHADSRKDAFICAKENLKNISSKFKNQDALEAYISKNGFEFARVWRDPYGTGFGAEVREESRYSIDSI